MAAAATPLPREDNTPPVIKINLVFTVPPPFTNISPLVVMSSKSEVSSHTPALKSLKFRVQSSGAWERDKKCVKTPQGVPPTEEMAGCRGRTIEGAMTIFAKERV
jgi:hypothetical protein